MPLRIVGCLLALLLTAVSGHPAPARLTPPIATDGVPTMTYDVMPARAGDGHLLGHLVLPAILSQAQAAGSRRPLLVVFNGGPGASTAWLQLGLLGTRQLVLPVAGATAGQAALKPNPEGLWDRTDILFVDPLGTGFSRPAQGSPDSRVRDWQGDADYLARAIRQWQANHQRLSAPLYLLGESYGSERALEVADILSREPGSSRLVGIVMLSQTVVSEGDLHDKGLSVATGLPTLAATACYHRLTGRAAAEPLACAERAIPFALNDYRRALSSKQAMPPARIGAMLAALAHATGLPRDVIARSGLVVTRSQYRQQAMATRHLRLGIYDSRVTEPARSQATWQDGSIRPLLATLEPAAQRNAELTLGLARSPVDNSGYVLFDPAIHAGWTYAGDRRRRDPESRVQRLSAVLARTGARLLIAGGIYDNVGSVGADALLARQLQAEGRSPIVQRYAGGHMFYLDPENRQAMIRTLKGFVRH